MYKKNNHNKTNYVEKKYDKFHNNFFTWQWLNKYLFSSIYKHKKAPTFFSVYCIFLNPFVFSNIYVSYKKKSKKKIINHHLAKSVSYWFSEIFLKFAIYKDV